MFDLKKAFIPFVVAGDPEYNTSKQIIKTLVDRGADMLEIGFAFSDPIADGPTIQFANNRALASGMNSRKTFELIKEIRDYTDIPISILIYSNLIYQQGIETFYRHAKEAGIDGVLVVDLPYEEAFEYIEAAHKYNINPVFLVAQTTTKERLKEILKSAKGYIYAVSVLGVTGARDNVGEETIKLIKRIKSKTILPVAVGFGISNQEQAKQIIYSGADGVIVGSAIIKLIESNLKNKNKMINEISRFVNKLQYRK